MTNRRDAWRSQAESRQSLDFSCSLCCPKTSYFLHTKVPGPPICLALPCRRCNYFTLLLGLKRSRLSLVGLAFRLDGQDGVQVMLTIGYHDHQQIKAAATIRFLPNGPLAMHMELNSVDRSEAMDCGHEDAGLPRALLLCRLKVRLKNPSPMSDHTPLH